jgi:Uma2 family endonuclease
VSKAIDADPPETIAEFDAFLDSQQDDSLWELVASRIVALPTPTEDHEQIAGNIGTPLILAMDPKGCRANQGGIRVQSSYNSGGQNKPRADVVVRCGPSGRRNYIADPPVVVEVLSPSTIDVDRGDGRLVYKGLPTLWHNVLVYQDQMLVEHYRRTDEGWSWETLTQPDDILHIKAVGFLIDLERVYFGAEPTNVHRLSR